MDHEPKSIDDQIDCLARLTGAPESFVAQVRLLFTRKGISLAEDATPYLRALEEAFVREESIRANARAQELRAANPLAESSDGLARAYLEQMARLRRVQSGAPEDEHTPAGPGGRRTLVVQQQRDDQPMVPGPEDVQ